jgi:copper chaperone CopZ
MLSQESQRKLATRSFFGGAVGAGLFTSCCTVPALLAALGLGTSGASAFIGTYRPWIVGAALLLMAAAAVSLIVRRRSEVSCGDACDPGTTQRTRRSISAAILVGTGIAVFGALPGLGASQQAPAPPAGASPQSERLALVMKVRGMSCVSCAAPIRKALTAIAPVADFYVDIDAGTVGFTVPVSNADVPAMRKAIEQLGYQTSDVRVSSQSEKVASKPGARS